LNLEADALAETVTLPAGDAHEIAFATQFWDEAESLVKEAEQINGAMIVPAVSELRYGGRKLIDYLNSLGAGDSKAQRTHLEDFVQCCIRARHDAVDALVSYITLYLEELEASVSADLIDQRFTGYTKLKQDLFATATLIAQSRRERQSRNDIYSVIKSDYIDGIIDGYRRLSQARAALFAEQNARDEKQHRASWIVAIAIALLAVALLATCITFLV
jgi:hypothetical protein